MENVIERKFLAYGINVKNKHSGQWERYVSRYTIQEAEQVFDVLADTKAEQRWWTAVEIEKIYELGKSGDFEYEVIRTKSLDHSDDLDVETEKDDCRVIILYDDDTDFIVKTNASPEVIKEALAYKNQMLEDDDPAFRSDFEEMQGYIEARGLVFEEIGYSRDVECYLW